MSEAESDDVNDSEVSHAGIHEFSKKLHQGLNIIICRWTGNARAAPVFPPAYLNQGGPPGLTLG